MRVVWNLEDWASAVVELPSAAVFAQRTWGKPSLSPAAAAPRSWPPATGGLGAPAQRSWASVSAGAPGPRSWRPASLGSIVAVVGTWAPPSSAPARPEMQTRATPASEAAGAPRAMPSIDARSLRPSETPAYGETVADSHRPGSGAAGLVCAQTGVSALPRRTVIVPNERVAHALQRTLIESGHAGVLMGASFVSARELAARLVRDAGETWQVSELELGACLAREALGRVEFAHFDPTVLALPGWDEAFARTLQELESAGLPLRALLASADARVRDIGRVFEEWLTLEHPPGESALFARATQLLQQGRAWEGATLAVVTGFESALEARFLSALPAVSWGIWGVRPLAPEHSARLLALYGEASVRALADARPRGMGAVREPARGNNRRASASPCAPALEHLRALLGDEACENEASDDGSLRIVLYPGLHQEVEAAVGWVVEQVVEHGVPLQEIALLSPDPDRYASALQQRLSALPWPVEARARASERSDVEARARAGERSDLEARARASERAGAVVFRERGELALERCDGARLLLTVRALREGLSREALAPLLSALRGRAQVPAVRGLSRARALLRVVGIAGGSRAHLSGGRAWPEAWESAVLALEGGSTAPAARALRRQLQLALAGLAPAIEALTDVLRSVLAGEPLSLLWTRLSAFGQVCLRVPAAEPPVWSLVERAVAAFEGDEEREPTGVEALEWLERTLRTLRVPPQPYGAPAVYIGSLAGVRGLSFRAVRVLGMVAGELPSVPHCDPLLCDATRSALSPLLCTARLHDRRERAAFADAVRAARERLVLSAPRRGAGGRAEAPAPLLFTALRAVVAGARAQQGAGAGAPGELDRQLAARSRRDRACERAARERLAVSAAAQLERIARAAAGTRARPGDTLERARAAHKLVRPARGRAGLRAASRRQAELPRGGLP